MYFHKPPKQDLQINLKMLSSISHNPRTRGWNCVLIQAQIQYAPNRTNTFLRNHGGVLRSALLHIGKQWYSSNDLLCHCRFAVCLHYRSLVYASQEAHLPIQVQPPNILALIFTRKDLPKAASVSKLAWFQVRFLDYSLYKT